MSRFLTSLWSKAAKASLSRSPKSGRPGKQSRPARPAPRLVVLEDRTLPSTFTAMNLDDSGTGSLRQAVLSANAHPGADVIDFAAGMHGTISLTSDQPNITDALSIAGPGEDRLTVSCSNASRVFDIGACKTASIADLTVAHGATFGGLGGGGILNEAGAALTLTNTAVEDNTASAASDAVDVFGGGLLNQSKAAIVSSTFSGNRALGGGGSSFFGGSESGGIDNFGGATLTVTDSREGAGGSDGHGVGCGVYDLGVFTPDLFTVIEKNHASTSNDDNFP